MFIMAVRHEEANNSGVLLGLGSRLVREAHLVNGTPGCMRKDINEQASGTRV